MNHHQEIIDFIRINRVSTSQIADCMNKSGVMPNIFPVNYGHHAVGSVSWIYAANNSNWSLHRDIQNVESSSIVLVSQVDCEDRALLGELVAKFLILYRQCSAVVVDGNIRDTNRIRKENWPVWCKSVSPVGCFNHEVDDSLVQDWVLQNRSKYNGTIAICDDCGIVIIPHELINSEMISKLCLIEENEDKWQLGINYHKKTTFQVICLNECLDTIK